MGCSHAAAQATEAAAPEAAEASIAAPRCIAGTPTDGCANIQCSDGSRAMADVAHASGPASPKPVDIVAEPASRPDSPDTGKLRVFISYRRDDLYFSGQSDHAPKACGVAWV